MAFHKFWPLFLVLRQVVFSYSFYQGSAGVDHIKTLILPVLDAWHNMINNITMDVEQESIKQSQQWFMACLPYAPGMAAALALHVRNLPDYDKQLHVLYLANDILLKR